MSLSCFTKSIFWYYWILSPNLNLLLSSKASLFKLLLWMLVAKKLVLYTWILLDLKVKVLWNSVFTTNRDSSLQLFKDTNFKMCNKILFRQNFFRIMWMKKSEDSWGIHQCMCIVCKVREHTLYTSKWFPAVLSKGI